MHITASVFTNDDESGLHHDYDAWPEKIAPHEPLNQYRHNDTGEDNADAHLKRQITGRDSLSRSDGRAAGLRDVGADLLRGVRRAQAEAGASEDHWGVGVVFNSGGLLGRVRPLIAG